MDEVFLDPEQAAKMLNLSAYTVRAYARQGIIPAHKIGRAWRFSRSDLEDWVLAKQEQHSPYGYSIARDTASLAAEDPLVHQIHHQDLATDVTSTANARQEAIETLRSIRARARVGSVSALLRESRMELLKRGNGDLGGK